MNLFRNKNRRQMMKTRSGGSEQGRDSSTNNGSSNNSDVVTADQPVPTLSPPSPEMPRFPPKRPTLHRMTSSLASYRATPITKHYALNNQILAAFEKHYANNHYTVAYTIGLQFVETALLEIPKHGYFYSSRHATERMTNSLDAIRVSNMLQRILEQQQAKPHDGGNELGGMDLSQELTKVRKLNALAVEQASEACFEQYEKQRAQLEAEINEMKKHEDCNTVLVDTCGPLLDSFTESVCPSGGFKMPFSASRGEERPPHFQQPEQQQSQQPSRDYQHYEPMPDQGDQEQAPPPPPAQKERSMSSMMRQLIQEHPDGPDEIQTRPSIVCRTNTGTTVPGPPKLTGGWTISLPDELPERPEFGRQMSGRTYADHVALERALYLSGLEVQQEGGPYEESDGTGSSNHSLVRDDDEWMLEHALKESEREMQRLKEQEERQLQQVYKMSEEEQQIRQLQHFKTPSTPHLQRRKTKSQLETQTLLMLYHEDFITLWDSGRIRVTHVGTYQGKLPGSVNGCTIIAPLLCIHHFINFTEPKTNNTERQNDPGLPDETIKNVIDEEVPSILPKVREELGVVQDAFLIPSDSHDYLIKNQLLSQQQFVTVIGGNILDERHMNELVRTLQLGTPLAEKTSPSSEKDKGAEETSFDTTKDDVAARRTVKIGCTLFFHEHVVSILKLQRAQDGKAWYDIIDSLPSKGMLSREVGSTLKDTENGGDEFHTHSVAAGNPIIDPLGFAMPEVDTPLDTARIRCLDEEALTAAIRWYACSKFNAENLHYIDNYPWDDLTTDFDPRVFQAFVWSEAAD